MTHRYWPDGEPQPHSPVDGLNALQAQYDAAQSDMRDEVRERLAEKYAPEKPLRDELIEDVVHVLRMDHGHTTRDEMLRCRTCERRAELVVDRVLRTLEEREILTAPEEQL